jgi:hypothetical protein
MCDMPGCDENKIYVWVFWKPEKGAPHMFWSRLCYVHYLESKNKVDDNAYFFMEENKNAM